MAIYRNIAGMLLALQRLRRQERWTRAQLESHRAAALARLRAHAYAHSPFYQNHHAGLMDRPLEELPVLTKAMLHDHFDEIITDRRVKRAAVAAHAQSLHGAEEFLGRYFVNASSGTSGLASYIVFNQAEWATALATFTRRERHIGSIWGLVQRPKTAVVASTTPWHISARIGATVRSSVLPMLRLDVGEPIESIVQQLNAWQPYLLATYASMAGILAAEQEAGRLQISPRRIVSSAEVLSPALRRKIQAVWGEILFDQYGATEGGTYAVECESRYHGSRNAEDHSRGLHLFEDLFIFEVVDHNNRPVPPGVYGDKVLLTVLFNQTQPLIRYELSDRVRIADKACSCGSAFALIEGIEGRREEVLQFPKQNGGTVAVHPMVFYRILDATPVHSWQVIQEPNRLCLRLTGEDAGLDDRGIANHVGQALERQNAIPPSIDVQWITGVQRGVTGKAARIVRRGFASV